jgi:DNA-binding GntR family transcriptional regulator
LGQTAVIIRKAILDGRLPPGQKLNEAALARQLGMSRGPVREALRLLTEHGLVRWEAHKGTFVADFTVQDLVEVVTVRDLLEPLAVSAALTEPHPGLLPGLRTALEAMHSAASSDDFQGLAQAHERFHGTFYTRSRHLLLGALWERMEAPLRLYVTVHQASFGPPTIIAEQHDEIFRLAETRDIPALQKHAREHLAANLKSVLARLSTPNLDQALELLQRMGPDASRLVASLAPDRVQTE